MDSNSAFGMLEGMLDDNEGSDGESDIDEKEYCEDFCWKSR